MEKINSNLSIVLLDDDDASLLYIKHLISITKKANIVASFNDPIKFIHEFPKLRFDLLMLDIEMPGMRGKEIIKIVGGDRCIVNTSSKERYEEAIRCHSIDILIKPVDETHLSKALKRAAMIILHGAPVMEYYMFNVAESKLKVRIRMSDILYTCSDKIDSRNKEIILRNGQKYTLMDCSFKYLLKIAPELVQVNHSEAVSIEMVNFKGFDEIILFELPVANAKKSVTLSQSYREDFKMRYPDM